MRASFRMNPSMVKEFVEITSKCDFDIDIASYNRLFVDAKSILGVLGLDMSMPLTASYDGYNDEFEAFLSANALAC